MQVYTPTLRVLRLIPSQIRYDAEEKYYTSEVGQELGVRAIAFTLSQGYIHYASLQDVYQ